MTKETPRMAQLSPAAVFLRVRKREDGREAIDELSERIPLSIVGDRKYEVAE
ncbi:MAG TPA: hypothetical protein VF234_10820 [Limnochordia bacterium]